MKFAPFRYLLTFSIVALGIAGCSGPAEESTETPAPAATPAATPAPDAAAATTPAAATSDAPVSAAPAAGTGGIAGKATFEGPAPKRATLETEGDPKCHAMHADAPLLSDREVVGADGGVQWAFAYIKNAPAGSYPVPDAAELDQIGCAYTPHVIGVRVGQKLNIKNTDPTLHNVRGIARNNKPFNFGQPPASAPRERVFDKAEMEIRVKCDLHSWMTGFIFAMDHPFFAVSDASGKFSIGGLPAGDYTLVVWHEAYGTQEIPVSVKAGADTDASVTFKPAA